MLLPWLSQVGAEPAIVTTLNGNGPKWMLSDPGILDMAWPGAGREQDDVDADVVAGTSVALHQHFRRRGDAGEAAFVDRMVKLGGGGAGLYLDKGDQRAAAGDDVDLARPGTDAAIENRPALQPQPPAGEPLATATGALGGASLGLGAGAG